MSGEVKKRTKSSKSKESKDKGLSSSTTTTKDDKEVEKVDETSPDPPPKFGPMPKLSPHRLWSRSALILGLMAVVWYNSNKKNETSFASVGEEIRYRGLKTKCSSAFDKHVAKFSGCVPNHCGRIVTDELVTPEEMYALGDLVTRGLKESKSSATTILDLSTGMLKFNGKSVDAFKANKTKPIFNSGDQLIFQSLKSKLMRMASSYFGVDYWALHLAAPVYFSRLEKVPEEGGTLYKSDEYWHPTVHQEIHESFDYSTVLFISDFGKDFTGGRFIFLDGDNTNRTIEARKGRALAFTSGAESKHFNEKITRGSRLTLTMGFTCNVKKGTKDPL